jgi:DNA-binding GntR family transcriptional regulator
MGMEATTKTLSKKVVNLPSELQLLPQLSNDDKYINIKRLYYGNGIPLVILDIFMPYNRFQDIDLNVSNQEGIYEHLYKFHDIKVTSSTRTFKVINIDKENAKILNMLPQTASYQGVSITYDQHKKIVDITRLWSIINYFFEMEYSKEDIEKIVAHHLFFI